MEGGSLYVILNLWTLCISRCIFRSKWQHNYSKKIDLYADLSLQQTLMCWYVRRNLLLNINHYRHSAVTWQSLATVVHCDLWPLNVEMVSPRKRILQSNIETRSQTPLQKVQSKSVPRAFKSYRFYLDVKKLPQSLIQDIKNLGGVSDIHSFGSFRQNIMSSLPNVSGVTMYVRLASAAPSSHSGQCWNYGGSQLGKLLCC